MKIENSNKTLTANEALILQQLYEDGGSDVTVLAKDSGLSRRYLLELIAKLKRRGLIYLESDYMDISVHITRAGRRLISYIWPEVSGARA